MTPTRAILSDMQGTGFGAGRGGGKTITLKQVMESAKNRMTDNDDVSLPGDQGMAGDYRVLSRGGGPPIEVFDADGRPVKADLSKPFSVSAHLDKVFSDASEEFDRVVRFGTDGVPGTPRNDGDFLIRGDAGFYMGKEIKR